MKMAAAAFAAVLILSVPAYPMKIGEFRNGQWVECDTADPNGCDSLSAKEISLEKKRGVYELTVKLNSAVTLNFILDTGASEVNFPAGIASMLLKTGTISREDFLPAKV